MALARASFALISTMNARLAVNRCEFREVRYYLTDFLSDLSLWSSTSHGSRNDILEPEQRIGKEVTKRLCPLCIAKIPAQTACPRSHYQKIIHNAEIKTKGIDHSKLNSGIKANKN